VRLRLRARGAEGGFWFAQRPQRSRRGRGGGGRGTLPPGAGGDCVGAGIACGAGVVPTLSVLSVLCANPIRRLLRRGDGVVEHEASCEGSGRPNLFHTKTRRHEGAVAAGAQRFPDAAWGGGVRSVACGAGGGGGLCGFVASCEPIRRWPRRGGGRPGAGSLGSLRCR
jgi:hypothetical protein